jgi:hypothetical protein
MKAKRTEFTYGDRTSFSFYDKRGQYTKENSDASPFACAFMDLAVRDNGRIFVINSVTDSEGRDISYLVSNDVFPNHVVPPRSNPNSPELRGMYKAIDKYVAIIERVHKHAEHSKLVFKID